MKALARGTFKGPPVQLQEAVLDRALFTTSEVDSFLQEWFPFDVETVPYAAEDGEPRVMLGRNQSYCSLVLPVSGADVVYHATLLIIFGNKKE